MKNVFSTLFVIVLPFLSVISAAPIADAETEELFRRTDSCTCRMSSSWVLLLLRFRVNNIFPDGRHYADVYNYA